MRGFLGHADGPTPTRALSEQRRATARPRWRNRTLSRLVHSKGSNGLAPGWREKPRPASRWAVREAGPLDHEPHIGQKGKRGRIGADAQAAGRRGDGAQGGQLLATERESFGRSVGSDMRGDYCTVR